MVSLDETVIKKEKKVLPTFETIHAGTGLPIPECWVIFEKALFAGIDRVILYGPPGTGKTFGGLTVHIKNTDTGENKETYRLVCTEDMTSADVSGCWMPNADGGFSYLKGSAANAWATGGRLVIDEIDKASGDVSALLLAFTDTVDSASFDLPTGERIKPAEGFSVVMTSNIEHPDELPIALRDRFPIAIKIDKPHPEALMKLPEKLRNVAAEIVGAKPGQRASLRAFDAFITLGATMTVTEAARLTFGAAMANQIISALKVGTLDPNAKMGV